MIFLVVAGLLSWNLARLAMSRFDFFDMSAYMDAGWRVAQGQRIYTDFFYMTGPVHPYLHAMFFSLIGFNKIAILTHLLTMHTVVLASVFILARRSTNLFFSLVISVIVSLTCFCTIAHPWYDINACTFVVLALLVLELNRPFQGKLRSWLAPGSCGLLIALSFLCKSNVGLSGGLVIGAAILASAISHKSWGAVVAYVIGGLLGLVAVLATLHSVRDFFEANLAYPAANRLTDWSKLIGVLFVRPFFVLIGYSIVIGLLCGSRFIRQHAVLMVLTFGLLAASVFDAWTGSALWSANILLLGVVLLYLGIVAYTLPRGDPASAQRRISLTAITIVWLLVILFLFIGHDMRLKAWTWKQSNKFADYQLKTESFAGWKCNHLTGEGVDASVDFIQQNVPASDSLMVLPDAQIIYGMTSRVAPVGTPFIFWKGDSPPPGKLRDQFKKQFEEHPPQWLLIHEQHEIGRVDIDAILEWTGLTKFVNTRYAEVWRFGIFSMRHLVPPGASTAPATWPSLSKAKDITNELEVVGGAPFPDL